MSVTSGSGSARRLLDPRQWPIAWRAPIILAVFMLLVAAGISKVVLSKLNETQTRHFAQLSDAYLEGLSTALIPHVIRRDPWEAFDILDRAGERYFGMNADLTVVTLADGRVLAASDPLRFPMNAPGPNGAPVGQDAMDPAIDPASDPASEANGSPIDNTGDLVWITRELRELDLNLGTIHALVDVSHYKEEQRQTLIGLIVFNAALTLLLAVIGWWLVRRSLAPLHLVTDRLAQSRDGRLAPFPDAMIPAADTEVGRAVDSYNKAAAAIAEREALLQRLAQEERAALIGRYASTMAHEVNNPLGGLFNAVRMIQRHGEDRAIREKAAHLIERGLANIGNVVKASLVMWRGRSEGCRLSSSDFDDLRYIVESETERRDLVLDWSIGIEQSCPIASQPVRQIALNLLLNACHASSPGNRVACHAWCDDGAFYLRVEDEGPGLPDEIRDMLENGPGTAIPSSRGLGIWTVARLVREHEGSIAVDPTPNTRITVRLPHVSDPALEAVA
ncbi:MAG: HAMP domain-containing histidine kinase [Salinarimonas sp.]|nr:HAMP domain-containing histidine kinase [Salinarimonas sp.]